MSDLGWRDEEADEPVTDTTAASGTTVRSLDSLLALRDGRILAWSQRFDLCQGVSDLDLYQEPGKQAHARQLRSAVTTFRYAGGLLQGKVTKLAACVRAIVSISESVQSIHANAPGVFTILRLFELVLYDLRVLKVTR